MSRQIFPQPFLAGVNLPWVTYGCDFGANAWRPEGGLRAQDAWRIADEAFASIARTGASVVRWFLLGDGRAGIVDDAQGWPAGVDDRLLGDVDAALDLARAHQLQILFVLFDFHWCHRRRTVNGVALGGRRRVLRDTGARRALLEAVVRPIVRRSASHPALWAWDIINEPEWATLGLGTVNPRRAIGRGAMSAFIAEAADLIHASAPQPVTVGSASARWLPLVRSAGLDFHQVHWYDRLERGAPLARPVSELGVGGPVPLGEFPTRGSRFAPAAIVQTAVGAGYAGALAWSWRAADSSTDPAAAASAVETAASFNPDARRPRHG